MNKMTSKEARTLFAILRLVGSDNHHEAKSAAVEFQIRAKESGCDYVDMAEHLTRAERSEAMERMVQVLRILQPHRNIAAAIASGISRLTDLEVARALSLVNKP